ncbi:MAG: hypothetical protein AAGI48_03835 [Verrucomicrobiota bacterium]
MNTLQTFGLLALVLLVLISLVAVMARWISNRSREVAVNAATDKTLENGIASLEAEAAFDTRYLLAAKGTASKSIILCTASLAPLGPCMDEPAIGDQAAVALLGAAKGTLRVVASKAIGENVDVFATDGGKVTDVVVSGAYWVGKTAPGSVAAADGDPIVIIPRFPRVNP